jgi:hypothetical protein
MIVGILSMNEYRVARLVAVMAGNGYVLARLIELELQYSTAKQGYDSGSIALAEAFALIGAAAGYLALVTFERRRLSLMLEGLSVLLFFLMMAAWVGVRLAVAWGLWSFR